MNVGSPEESEGEPTKEAKKMKRFRKGRRSREWELGVGEG